MSICARNRHFMLQQRLQQRRRESQDISLSETQKTHSDTGAVSRYLPDYILSARRTETRTDETYLSGNR